MKRATRTGLGQSCTTTKRHHAHAPAGNDVSKQHSNLSRHVELVDPKWRLELFFKSRQELLNQIPFLKSHGLLRLNITNKATEDKLLDTLKDLATHLCSCSRDASTSPGSATHDQRLQPPPTSQHRTTADSIAEHLQPVDAPAFGVLDVCLHFSLKYQSEKTPECSATRLLEFCSALQRLQQQQQDRHTDAGITVLPGQGLGAGKLPAPFKVHVLLVSGGGKKKRFDTVAALQWLSQWQRQQQQQQGTQVSSNAGLLPSLAVAFNPYLPQEGDAKEEQARLQAKLESGLVDKIYLQMGTDLPRLQSALTLIRELCQRLQLQQAGFKTPQLLGSVFLPSKRLLAQMRFRPWNGVFLSEEYLSSVEAAQKITEQLLAVYASAGVVPLLESAVKSDDELQRAQGLLKVVRH